MRARMHDGELEIDSDLVRRLLAAQFPRWAGLALERVGSFGTDLAIFRLGEELAVRLPRIEWAADQPLKEQEWLPVLAPHLPLAVPVPLATGVPGEDYPWHWSVVPWLPGDDLTVAPLADPVAAARQLAEFVLALRELDPTGAPPARFASLERRDRVTREAIAQLDGRLDTAAATAAWEAALGTPLWEGSPLWSHGDLLPGNLLAADGRLTAAIDFGCLGAGDPACDLLAAWSLFRGEAREAYRAALGVDDTTWARGRAFALSAGLLQVPYYETTNPTLAAIGGTMIEETLAETAMSGV
jgi:aminoglycoside phosphotransferase (APT) family kinase protein